MSKLRDNASGHDVGSLVRRPPLSPNASVGKKWKFRRNAVIYVAYRGGVSQRILADVFDLPRSRIAAIVKEFAGYG